MIGWDACVNEPNSLLRWLECHPGSGSYLQLIGVALAIGASAWISQYTTRQTLRPILDERVGRARVLLYRLMPAIASINATVVRIRKMYTQTEGGMLLAAAQKLNEAVHYFRIDTNLPEDVLRDLHVLDEATAEDIAQLYFYLSQYNNFIDRNVPLLRAFDGAERTGFAETFEALIGAVETLSTESWGRLQKQRAANESEK